MNCSEINQLDPIELLLKFNINYVSKKGDEYSYHAPYREDNSPSLSVNISKRYWIDFGSGSKGKNIDLLMKLYNTVSVSDTLRMFNKQFTIQSFSFSQLKKKSISNEKFKSTVTIKNISSLKSLFLLEYLQKRGVSKRAWMKFIVEISYQKREKVGYGIGFENDSGGFEVRNKLMKFCIGKKDITTIVGIPNKLVVLEGFFDFLSFVELGIFYGQSIIVMNSTVNTERVINKINKDFKEARIDMYLDNDDVGIKAFEAIKKSCEYVFDQSNIYEKFNDLNDYLINQLKNSIDKN